MISATILPCATMDEATIDQVVDSALRSGLIACNRMRGPFRIAFFPKNGIPAGWSKIGFAIKSADQGMTCAA